MANIIKIATTNDGLDLSNNGPLMQGPWTVIDGEISGTNFASAQNLQTETDGNGQGLIINFYFNQVPDFLVENSFNTTSTSGYKVGDQISFTVESGTVGNEFAFTIAITLTVEMLSFEGDKVQYMPVFDANQGFTLNVVPPSSVGVSGQFYWQIPNLWGNHNNCWRINIIGTTSSNRVLITDSINKAFAKAAQAPNSHPTIKLPNGVACSSVEWANFQQPSPPAGSGSGSGAGDMG